MIRPAPKNVWLKAAGFLAIVAIGFALVRFTPLAGLLTQENMVDFFETLRQSWWAPLLLIGLFAFTSPLGAPVSVYMVGSGAVFGFLAGSVYNLIGLLLGMTSSYYLARALGRDFVIHVTRGRLRRVERIFERSGFWPLVQVRFMPIPFAAVNFGAALAGVKAPLFLTAGLIGLVPATLVHTFFFARLFETSGRERFETLVWYVVVLVAFNLLISYPSIRNGWRRRHRYRELVEDRRGRIPKNAA